MTALQHIRLMMLEFLFFFSFGKGGGFFFEPRTPVATVLTTVPSYYRVLL